MRRGFTLLELLIVIVIIVLISAVTLPMVIPAMSHRQVSEGARILQGSLVGARDAAIRDNTPTGIRLIPDPAFPITRLADGTIDPSKALAASRIIPLALPKNYSNGTLSQWQGALPQPVVALTYIGPGTTTIPNPTWGMTSALMVYEDVLNADGLPSEPAAWFWNVKVGEKVQINNIGKWYTVVGPMVLGPAQGNNEMFVNVGSPGAPNPWTFQIMAPTGTFNVAPEFLLLVNGIDDNHDGYVDNGWDGVDNNGDGLVDDIGEWVEMESW